jgi:hypothetical protein
MNNLTELSKDQISKSVYTDKPFGGLSPKYTHIPTNILLQDMEKLGWKVCETKEVKSKKKTGFQKHIVKFYHPDIMIKGENGDDVYVQIILINSHDGSSTFQFRIGIYRIVCENGLIVASIEFSKVRIRHMGYNFEELRNTVSGLVKHLPIVTKKIETFRDSSLSDQQMIDFATKAAVARFGDKFKINAVDLLGVNRDEDKGNSLWSVYNRVQEKLMNGGFLATNIETGKGRVCKSVKAIDRTVQLNEELWQLAETFCGC